METTATEIRTRKTPLMEEMIAAVIEAIGPRDEAELIATIGYCRTPAAAVKRCKAAFGIADEAPMTAEEDARLRSTIAADLRKLEAEAADQPDLTGLSDDQLVELVQDDQPGLQADGSVVEMVDAETAIAERIERAEARIAVENAVEIAAAQPAKKPRAARKAAGATAPRARRSRKAAE